MKANSSYRVSATWTPRYRYAWTLAHVGNGFWGGGNPIPLYLTAEEARRSNPEPTMQPVRVRLTIAEPERGENS